MYNIMNSVHQLVMSGYSHLSITTVFKQTISPDLLQIIFLFQ